MKEAIVNAIVDAGLGLISSEVLLKQHYATTMAWKGFGPDDIDWALLRERSSGRGGLRRHSAGRLTKVKGHIDLLNLAASRVSHFSSKTDLPNQQEVGDPVATWMAKALYAATEALELV